MDGEVRRTRTAHRPGDTLDGAGMWGVALLRLILIVLLVAGAGAWLYFAGVDMNEVRQLAADGRTATGRSSAGILSFVKGSYRLHSLRVSHHADRGSRGSICRTAPRLRAVSHRREVHCNLRRRRLSRAQDRTRGLVVCAETSSLLAPAACGGGAYLFMPLWLLEFRRLHRKDKNSYLANPAP